jgi:hypothetical protein
MLGEIVLTKVIPPVLFHRIGAIISRAMKKLGLRVVRMLVFGQARARLEGLVTLLADKHLSKRQQISSRSQD